MYATKAIKAHDVNPSIKVSYQHGKTSKTTKSMAVNRVRFAKPIEGRPKKQIFCSAHMRVREIPYVCISLGQGSYVNSCILSR